MKERQSVIAGFSAFFEYQIDPNLEGYGEGLTFVLHNSPDGTNAIPSIFFSLPTFRVTLRSPMAVIPHTQVLGLSVKKELGWVMLTSARPKTVGLLKALR